MRQRALAFLFCSVAAGGNIPANLQEGYRTIQEKDLKADLTFLASDQLEGRLSLTRGSEVNSIQAAQVLSYCFLGKRIILASMPVLSYHLETRRRRPPP